MISLPAQACVIDTKAAQTYRLVSKLTINLMVMLQFRATIAQIIAFSIIATQLVCGCISLPETEVLAAFKDAPVNAVKAPCHGGDDEKTTSTLPRDDDHNCAHCDSSGAMATVADVSAVLPTGELDYPDFGPTLETSGSVLAAVRQNVGTGPPPHLYRAPPETLVSLNIQLLI